MELILQNISIQAYSLIVLSISMGISYVIIPRLIVLVNYKNLMDNPNERSSHSVQIPTLGGIAFFISISISLFFMHGLDSSGMSIHLMTGLVILFIIGLKDDLMVLAPKTKIIAQLVAITFVLLNPDIHLVNFHGFMGLYEIPLWLGISFTYFIILSIINAYNLVDGIDGLASMLGIVIFGFFAFIFYELELYYYFLLSAASTGFLIAFLRYNLSSTQKIFMGDTGSMIVGFLIGLLTLKLLALDSVQLQMIHVIPGNLFILTLAILFVLFMDTIRVIAIRLIQKRGIFSPDRNHIHHILIDLGLSHRKASMIISTYSILVISIFFGLNNYLPSQRLELVLTGTSLITLLLIFHWNPNRSALRQKIRIKTLIIPKRSLLREIRFRNSLVSVFRIFF